MTGIRLEDDSAAPASQQAGHFINLVDGASISHFTISSYGDGDSGFPLISGNGSLVAGEIIGHGVVNVTGTIDSVNLKTADKAVIAASSIRQCTIRAAGGVTAVAGDIELDDGRGGVLVHQASLFGPGTAIWKCAGDGLFEAQFAGDRMLLHTSGTGGLFAVSCKSVA